MNNRLITTELNKYLQKYHYRSISYLNKFGQHYYYRTKAMISSHLLDKRGAMDFVSPVSIGCDIETIPAVQYDDPNACVK